jgi:hypothetical protein
MVTVISSSDVPQAIAHFDLIVGNCPAHKPPEMKGWVQRKAGAPVPDFFTVAFFFKTEATEAYL